MIQKYRVKKLYDGGKHIGYSAPRRITGQSILHKDEEMMYGNVDAKHLMVDEIQPGKWVIVEDFDMKTAEQQKEASKQNLKDTIDGLQTSDLNTVAKLQPIVLKLARALKDLL